MYIAVQKETHRRKKRTGGYQYRDGKCEGQYRGMGIRDSHYYT